MPDSVHGRQRKAFDYLANQARSAHMENDGLLVNHLCAIALHQIGKLSKSNSLLLSVKDFYWAFALALYWFSDDYMFFLMDDVFKSLEARDTREEPVLSVIRACLYMIEQPFADAASTAKELKKHAADWLTRETECEDVVLLTLAVELIWWHRPEGSEWRDTVRLWQSQTYTNVHQELEKTGFRLELQSRLLHGTGISDEDETLLSSVETGMLVKAWDTFLNGDWKALDDVLKQLSNISSFDSPFAVPLFHLHHLSRFYRNALEPQIIGLTRRKVQVAKTDMFGEMRDGSFYRKLSQLWQMQGSYKGASERFHCFRIAMLNELSAIRGWDLAAWMDGVAQEHSAARELFRFENEPFSSEIALWVVRSGVLSHTFKTDDRVLMRAIQMLDRASDEERAELVGFLLSARKYYWSDVLSAFSLLSDAIPESLLESTANWCNTVYQILPFGTSPSRVLSIWRDVFGKTSDSDKLCSMVYPIAKMTAHDWRSWGDEEYGLQEYMISAPIECALGIVDAMFSVTIPDHDSFYLRRWGMVYNTALERREIAQACRKWLVSGAKRPAERLYLSFLYPDFATGTESVEIQVQQQCRESAIGAAQAIAKRNQPSGVLGGGIDHTMFGHINWPEPEPEMITILMSAVDAPFANSNEISSSLICLSKLVMKGHESHAKMVRKRFLSWLTISPKGTENAWSTRKGPLSAAQINTWGPEEIFIGLCHLAVAMYIRDRRSVAKPIANWIIRNSFVAPLKGNALFFYLTCLISLSSAFTQADFLSCMQTCFMRSSQRTGEVPPDESKLPRLLGQIKALLKPDSTEPARITIMQDSKRRLLFKTLTSWLAICSRSDDALVRLEIAQIIDYWKHYETLPADLEVIADQLKRDARARVRSAALR